MSEHNPTMFLTSSSPLLIAPRIDTADETHYSLTFSIGSRLLSRRECTSDQAHALLRSSIFRRPVRVMCEFPTSAAAPDGLLSMSVTAAPVWQDQYEEMVAVDAFVPDGLGLCTIPTTWRGSPSARAVSQAPGTYWSPCPPKRKPHRHVAGAASGPTRPG